MLLYESKVIKREPLTPKEMSEARQKFGSKLECSFAKDKDGNVYCHTQRARSKSYPTVTDIPKSTYKFICSTG